MDIWTLLLMSAGLAMDAFAVSVSSGIVLCHTCWRQTVRISGSFGFFQGLMPLIGYTIARTFADKISAFDHWARCCGRSSGAARRICREAIPAAGRICW